MTSDRANRLSIRANAVGSVGNAGEEQVSTPNAIAESARDLAQSVPRRGRNEPATDEPDPEAGSRHPTRSRNPRANRYSVA